MATSSRRNRWVKLTHRANCTRRYKLARCNKGTRCNKCIPRYKRKPRTMRSEEIVHIGFLGGTFDMPHRGHAYMAEYARFEHMLKLVIWIPNGVPPHKTGVRPGELRLKWVDYTIEGNPYFRSSDIEVNPDLSKRTGTETWTVETIPILKAQLEKELKAKVRLSFIVGEDTIETFYTRYKDHADRIVKMVRLLVAPRSTDVVECEKKLEIWRKEWWPGADIELVHCKPMPVSSTDLRNMIKVGNPAWRYWVEEKVYEDIVASGCFK